MKIVDFEIDGQYVDTKATPLYYLYTMGSDKTMSLNGIIDQERVDNFEQEIRNSCDKALNSQNDILETMMLSLHEDKSSAYEKRYLIIPIHGDVTIYEQKPIMEEETE